MNGAEMMQRHTSIAGTKAVSGWFRGVGLLRNQNRLEEAAERSRGHEGLRLAGTLALPRQSGASRRTLRGCRGETPGYPGREDSLFCTSSGNRVLRGRKRGTKLQATFVFRLSGRSERRCVVERAEDGPARRGVVRAFGVISGGVASDVPAEHQFSHGSRHPLQVLSRYHYNRRPGGPRTPSIARQDWIDGP